MIPVEPESATHREAIGQVTAAAFAASLFGHHGEAELIDRLRTVANPVLSLVAVRENLVVGHILFTPTTIQREEQRLHGMGLGPMAVLPEHQGQGIGSLLVTEGLRRLKSETPFTVVAGDRSFYSRFGFMPAAKFGITHGFAGMPQDVFFVHADDLEVLKRFRGGRVYYHSEFGPQHCE